MSSLRIHFLTQGVQEQGTYFRFHNLAVGLTNLGQDVTVFGCDWNPASKEREEIRDGVQYHIVPVFQGTSLFGSACHPLTAIRRCFVDYPPCDVAHLFQPFPSAALPWYWNLPKKTKLLFYDWDDLWIGGLVKSQPKLFREYWLRFVVNYLEQQLPQRALHVTTCSHFLAKKASKRNASQVSVIHNGLWPFVIPDQQAARESLGLDSQALYVGFMGRTCAELSWCFEALENNLHRHSSLRLALCGPPDNCLDSVPKNVLKRMDFLGTLPPLKTRNFAAALDLGLLPLEDNSFNQSRFPIKYAEYMAASTPVLCSDIGECANLSDGMPWVIKAGKTKKQWLDAFENAIHLMLIGQLSTVDINTVVENFSWNLISKKLLEIYWATITNIK
ncbi:glycosyltransferase [Moorena sp. SIO3I6]|uniref:glycosyltransferase n=1 Tax=Moorena sp. SIO3I6 TaxID=2607831 RepID=UPI0013FA5B6A|nr:glycosyltransferase [Moorena sp. SIO3I6]NEP25918.1 glycosyltransferase family 4 protein [Moorena sp. SIO3I6]